MIRDPHPRPKSPGHWVAAWAWRGQVLQDTPVVGHHCHPRLQATSLSRIYLGPMEGARRVDCHHPLPLPT